MLSMMTTLKLARWPEQSPRIKLGVSSSGRNPTIKTLATRTLTLIGICSTNPASVPRELQPIWWGGCTQVITSKRDCQGWLRSEARGLSQSYHLVGGGHLASSAECIALSNASNYSNRSVLHEFQYRYYTSAKYKYVQKSSLHTLGRLTLRCVSKILR